MFVDSGIVTLTTYISPYKADRELVRNLLEDGEFVEVYVKCNLQECAKGLYKKAGNGDIQGFTAIDDP